MPLRLPLTFSIGLCLLYSLAPQARAADAPAADPGAALAWRLDMISSSLLGPAQPPAAWRRSAALLEAAGRLDPAELRFPRLRTLALLHVGDTDAAIDAIRDYRRAALQQHVADPAVQIQLIDLYASKEETVDAKLSYLQSLLDKQNIPPEVRAHVAVQCALLLSQKSPEQAAEMARRAVDLYPLPDATKLYYELAGRQQPPKERLAALLAVLQANPEQPGYLSEVANLLATNGLAEPSLQWYDLAIAVTMRSGTSRPPEFHSRLIDYASELIIAGRGQAADTLLGQMLDEQPLDPDAWFLKLTETRASAEQVTQQQTLELARSAFVRRWNLLHDDILSGHVTTQPAASQPAQGKVEPADVGPVLQKLKGAHDVQAQDAFVGVVSDLAWFELYYAKNAQGAKPWIDALATMLSPDSLVLQRLQGWQALVSGQAPQAHEIFAKVADKDPLSKLGLLKSEQATSRPVDEEAARKLLEEHRTGLTGAILWDALRSEKTIPATQPVANELKEQVAKFPSAWFALLDPRQVRRVYDIRAEPLDMHVAYGDAMLARITIVNNSDRDVTISPDGLLRPDLWFDAQIMGLDQQAFRGVAFDQIANQIVLRAHTSISQIVRLDEGDLRKVLDVSPGASTRVSADVITNPISISDAVVPGPAGAAANFSRTMVYIGLPITTPAGRKQIDAGLASANPLDKLRALDLAAAYVRVAARPDADESLRKAVADLPQAIEKLRKDASPQVSAWANYLAAMTAKPDQQAAIVSEMAGSADWTTRLLSLFSAASLPEASRKEIASRLAQNDPDATVKAAAAATSVLLEHPATQPTTQPTTEPAATGS